MRPPSKHELLENEVKHLQELALENLIGACEMDGYGHFIEPCLEKPTPMSKHDLVENAPFGRLKQTHRR